MTVRISTLAFATLATIVCSCVSPEEHNRALRANENLLAQLAELRDYQRSLAEENEKLRTEVLRLGKVAKDAAWIEEQRSKLARLLEQYKEGGQTALPGGVELVQTAEGVAFRVAGSLLFASGKAEITQAGKDTLSQLIATLSRAGRRIRVDGHTDDQPIQFSSWKSNLELSANRALAVAHFLVENGIDPEDVSIAAFGEWRPAQPGSTEEARRANRRVEIQVFDG